MKNDKFCVNKILVYLVFSVFFIISLFYVINYLNRQQLSKNPKAAVNQNQLDSRSLSSLTPTRTPTPRPTRTPTPRPTRTPTPRPTRTPTPTLTYEQGLKIDKKLTCSDEHKTTLGENANTAFNIYKNLSNKVDNIGANIGTYSFQGTDYNVIYGAAFDEKGVIGCYALGVKPIDTAGYRVSSEICMSTDCFYCGNESVRDSNKCVNKELLCPSNSGTLMSLVDNVGQKSQISYNDRIKLKNYYIRLSFDQNGCYLKNGRMLNYQKLDISQNKAPTGGYCGNLKVNPVYCTCIYNNFAHSCETVLNFFKQGNYADRSNNASS
ncbi:MAG: hypothetical protein NC935_08245 [Candidatus Omnitrophica bacterium]|nr:hypothetical protein [Candidatus Omnitrophota bacterium]